MIVPLEERTVKAAMLAALKASRIYLALRVEYVPEEERLVEEVAILAAVDRAIAIGERLIS